MKYAPLTGWRYAAVFGGLVGAICLALYPIGVVPMINPEKYSKLYTIILIYFISFIVVSLQKKFKQLLGQVLNKKIFNLEVSSG